MADPGAFLKVSPNGEIGGRGAGCGSSAEGAIAPVKARDYLLLLLLSPGASASIKYCASIRHLAFVGAANAAQEMQRPEDLGASLQVSIIGHRDWWSLECSSSSCPGGWLGGRALGWG